MVNTVSYIHQGEEPQFDNEFLCKQDYNLFLLLLSFVGRYNRSQVAKPVVSAVSTIGKFLRKANMPANKLPKAFAPTGQCVAGSMKLFVDVDGWFYACERISETSPDSRIGHIDSGFDIKQVQKILNFGSLINEKCKVCWALQFCSLCVDRCDSGHGLTEESILQICKMFRQDTHYYLCVILLLKYLGIDSIEVEE